MNETELDKMYAALEALQCLIELSPESKLKELTLEAFQEVEKAFLSFDSTL